MIICFEEAIFKKIQGGGDAFSKGKGKGIRKRVSPYKEEAKGVALHLPDHDVCRGGREGRWKKASVQLKGKLLNNNLC